MEWRSRASNDLAYGLAPGKVMCYWHERNWIPVTIVDVGRPLSSVQGPDGKGGTVVVDVETTLLRKPQDIELIVL